MVKCPSCGSSVALSAIRDHAATCRGESAKVAATPVPAKTDSAMARSHDTFYDSLEQAAPSIPGIGMRQQQQEPNTH
jgi:hypothetical protein